MKISELKQLVREAVEEIGADLGSKPYIIEGKYMWVRDDVAEKIMALPTTKFSTGSGARNFRDGDYAYFMETTFQYRGNTSKYKAEIALRKYTAKLRYPGYSFVIAAKNGDFGFGFTWMLTKHIFSARLHKVMFDAAAKFIDEKVKPDTLKEEGEKKDVGGLRQHVMSRLSKLPKYKGNQAALNAAVNKIISLAQCGDPRVCEMWTAWENQSPVNEEAGGEITVKATVEANVYPIAPEDIEKIAEQYQLVPNWKGSPLEFGFNNVEFVNRYSVTFTGPQGQVDAFINHMVEEGDGIEFDDTVSATGSLKENAAGTQKIRWSDGKELEVSNSSKLPIGPEVEFLGDIEVPSESAPQAKDWHAYSAGNNEYVHWSPSTKKAFKSKVAHMMVWSDGVRVDMDDRGNPIGYKYLGWLNSGIKVPEAKDWREFYYTNRGHGKSLSPSLKVWYEVDSSD